MWHWPQKQSFQSPNIFNPSSASYLQLEHYPILSLIWSYSSQSTSKPQLWLSLAQLSPSLFCIFFFLSFALLLDYLRVYKYSDIRILARVYHFICWLSSGQYQYLFFAKLNIAPTQLQLGMGWFYAYPATQPLLTTYLTTDHQENYENKYGLTGPKSVHWNYFSGRLGGWLTGWILMKI